MGVHLCTDGKIEDIGGLIQVSTILCRFHFALLRTEKGTDHPPGEMGCKYIVGTRPRQFAGGPRRQRGSGKKPFFSPAYRKGCIGRDTGGVVTQRGMQSVRTLSSMLGNCKRAYLEDWPARFRS